MTDLDGRARALVAGSALLGLLALLIGTGVALDLAGFERARARVAAVAHLQGGPARGRRVTHFDEATLELDAEGRRVVIQVRPGAFPLVEGATVAVRFRRGDPEGAWVSGPLETIPAAALGFLAAIALLAALGRPRADRAPELLRPPPGRS
jgi:hypothetical protein